ncbi:hypothetical protein LWI29_027094 [Acer saccharum]|uniref:CCR4-NOT transcription complex subunit 4 n=1 Tax=Acer saccharum TaxID=4024 RepID=A0AA39SAF2_ACESA|nr:hypothetical protein LWI29_027094 [Acer saccharum]
MITSSRAFLLQISVLELRSRGGSVYIGAREACSGQEEDSSRFHYICFFASSLAIMSEKGEKTCPLCAEEMDLTDQQLKPCKCGYEICVWCWHHIMDMAERDSTEGRCPACRTPYDKEKIVAMAANCERMVAEINTERKQKTQKAKPKASEGRMHLTNIRVVQRNLVYIIGLPLNLADEELLQKREYFGLYGKVLKVSISRTASGDIQHSSNNSCCVYITYSKEDEAIRCIQSVHSFILEGRPLRACFGTTKYCHAWLRNMPCTIPDCLYLHDFGPQEDSFSKDDIVSAFTRSKVQQVIGATNNMHGRSGNVLPPPPTDEHNNSNLSSSTNPIANNSSNNIGNQNNGSRADNGTGRSNALPAAASWVTRVSASLPPIKNLSGSGRPPSDQPKTSSSTQFLKSEVVSISRSTNSMKSVASHEGHLNSTLDLPELAEDCVDGDPQIDLSNTNVEDIVDTTPATATSKNNLSCLTSAKGSDRDIAALPTITSYLEHTKPFTDPGYGDDDDCHVRDFQGLCSGLSSIRLQSHLKKEHSVPVVSSVSNHIPINFPQSQGSQADISEQYSVPITSSSQRETATMEDLLESDYQNLNGSEGIYQLPSVSSTCSLQNLNKSSYPSWQPGEASNQSYLDAHTRIVPMKQDEVSSPLTSQNPISKHNEVALPWTHTNFTSDGFNNNKASSFVNWDATIDHSSVFSEMGLGNYLGKCDNDTGPLHSSVASDMGESSIISKILSIDSDVWEDSLTSPQSLVSLLSENDKQHGSLKFPSLLKESDGRQSRFSFARQEDFSNHLSHLEHSLVIFLCLLLFQKPQVQPLRDSQCHAEHPLLVFFTHETKQRPFDSSASHLLQSSQQTEQYLLQTSTPAARTGGRYEDVEFVDPAILEVGKGVQATILNNRGIDTRPTSSLQLNPFDHDARHQLLMRQPLSGYQDQKFPNPLTNTFAPPNNTYSISPNDAYSISQNDAYSISPMLLDQSEPSNPSMFVQSSPQQFRNLNMSSGHLGNWNEVKSIGDLGVSDLMTNGGLGYNKFISSYEDLKCQMSNSRNLYNRGFAM